MILNNIFKSDLAFNLIRKKPQPQSQSQDDDHNHNANANADDNHNGDSGRNYALVSADMWIQALKWSVRFLLPIYVFRIPPLCMFLLISFTIDRKVIEFLNMFLLSEFAFTLSQTFICFVLY